MLRRRTAAADDMAVSHEINVTPFIDVMLVLLIIFMIVAPLSTVDIPVHLPSVTAKAAARPDKPIYLTIKRDDTLALDNDPVTLDALTPALDALTREKHDTRIYLRADKGVLYDDVMHVMNKLRQGGYLKIALVGLDAGG